MMMITFGQRGRKGTLISDLLVRHFGKTRLDELSISERVFPLELRADLQRAIDRGIATEPGLKRFCGLSQTLLFGVDLSALILQSAGNLAMAVPPQYEEVDIGEDKPVRCLKVGLWLMEQNGQRFAVLYSPAKGTRRIVGVRFQIAAFNNEAGARIVERLFESIEKVVNECPSYRGKILSLEEETDYRGKSSGLRVHRLRPVDRNQVILPKKTLSLLERNVLQFVKQREQLARSGQSTKKGILFYGPPGTGKTHTIQYLAGALQGHTMLLITAAQTSLLGDYMSLARLLQPSVVVIEDVDLIARQRETINGPREQELLNSLLNEMDGLKENADILFILTTNQPEALESALASRPGRIDQAIEFPLPDDEARERLVRLYAGSMTVPDELVQLIVRKTANVSGAFIKELMRRSVQFQIERAAGQSLGSDDVRNALEEMLFSGGALNLKLLGGKGRIGFDSPAESEC
jgi:hypothetical protein